VVAASLDYSVVAVPRTTADGEWRQEDAQLVEAALRSGGSTTAAAPLLGLSERELVELATADGVPAFRGRQLHSAMYGLSSRAVRDLADITTLARACR
jgi:hypothetical protein